MASIQYSALVTDIKGKIQGSVFQKGSTRNIIRNKGATMRKSQPSQQLVHQKLQDLRREWSLRSLAEKSSWNAFAATYQRTDKFGTLRSISGYNFFVSINSNRLQLGLTVLASAPVYVAPAAVPTSFLYLNEFSMGINFATPIDFSQDQLIIYASDQMKVGTLNYWNKLRYIKTMTVAGTMGFNINNEWSTLYGKSWPPVGGAGNFDIGVGLFRININSGIATPWLLTSQTMA